MQIKGIIYRFTRLIKRIKLAPELTAVLPAAVWAVIWSIWHFCQTLSVARQKHFLGPLAYLKCLLAHYASCRWYCGGLLFLQKQLSSSLSLLMKSPLLWCYEHQYCVRRMCTAENSGPSQCGFPVCRKIERCSVDCDIFGFVLPLTVQVKWIL